MPGATSEPENSGPRSRDFEVFRRRSAAVGHEFVLHGLTFIERAQPGALDGRDMDEDVLVAACRFDEPVALGRIEPFDGALLHRLPPQSLCQRRRELTGRRTAADAAIRATSQILEEVRNSGSQKRSSSPTTAPAGWPKSDCR